MQANQVVIKKEILSHLGRMLKIENFVASLKIY